MRGVGGLNGWRWIFILEGILTIIISVAAYFFVVNYPATAKFLNEDERIYIQTRLSTDTDVTRNEAFTWANFSKALNDPKVWLYGFGFHTLSLPLYTLSLFLPIIIKELGYSAAQAQLLSVPPYAIATALTLLVAVASEKVHRRVFFIMGSSSIAIIGYILLLTDTRPSVFYLGTIFAASGIYSATTIVLSWPANNVSGQTKRATANAMQISIGNLGVVLSTQLYRNESRPRFFVGHGMALGYLVVNILVVGTLWWILKRENERRDRELGAERLRGIDEGEWLGDEDPRWRFQTWSQTLSFRAPSLGIRWSWLFQQRHESIGLFIFPVDLLLPLLLWRHFRLFEIFGALWRRSACNLLQVGKFWFPFGDFSGHEWLRPAIQLCDGAVNSLQVDWGEGRRFSNEVISHPTHEKKLSWRNESWRNIFHNFWLVSAVAAVGDNYLIELLIHSDLGRLKNLFLYAKVWAGEYVFIFLNALTVAHCRRRPFLFFFWSIVGSYWDLVRKTILISSMFSSNTRLEDSFFEADIASLFFASSNFYLATGSVLVFQYYWSIHARFENKAIQSLQKLRFGLDFCGPCCKKDVCWQALHSGFKT